MWHIIPDSFRTHWKDWELRLLVLSSLLLQLTLIPTGTRRKATQRAWIQILVWVTYLTAESVPIMTLGVISNWLSNMKEQSSTGTIDRKNELIALWVPIVLVHLGGPDSITAYSLEDNELWLRHFARVSVQIGWTCYVYFLALSSSPLSYIAIAIIIIGILKNFERTLSLFYASKDEFRESLISPPRSGLLYPRLTESFSLRTEEGHTVTLKGIAEVQASSTLSLPRNHILEKPQDRNAFIANQLLKVFEVLFAGLIVNLKALENIKSLLTEVTSENAFKIIDIELNLMFESLYTKANIIYRPLGIFSKIITLVLTPGVLVAFCMVDKRVYELKLDLSITFMVILGLLLNEIYSIIKVFSSDRMYALFIERKPSLGYRIISWIQSRPAFDWLGFTTEEWKWSTTLSQFNILGLAVLKTPKTLTFNDKVRKLYEKAVQYFSVTYVPLGDSLRMWIHDYLKKNIEELKEDDQHHDEPINQWLPAYAATKRLKKMNLEDLIWSTSEDDFAQGIVIWHIATEILYYKSRKSIINDGDVLTMCEISRSLSKYLVYLLVQKPAMLPIGVGDNYYAHTLLEARKFFEVQSSRITPHKAKNFRERIGLRKNYEHEQGEKICRIDVDKKKSGNEENKPTSNISPKAEGHESQEELDLCRICTEGHDSQVELDLCRICHMLLGVPYEPDIKPKLVEGGNKSVLFHACHLAFQLVKSCPELKKQWKVIRIVWTEALLYSAYHSTGDVHAKQLSYGGELLTHVWLLMAHFGVSKQVKASTMLALKRLVQS